MSTTTTRTGTWVERKAWILLAVIAGLLILFGTTMMLPADLTQPIQGSACCTGRIPADAEPWTASYMGEMARYMGTFTIGMGILAMATVVFAFRRRQRWAWAALWVLPALFLFHGAVLGSFPFDLVPLVISLAGLLLPIRLFTQAGNQTASNPQYAPA
jgi:hypothetical protein